MPSPDFAAHRSVQRYAATLTDLTLGERGERLDLLESFAVYVERDPDTMVEEIFDEATRKYRKRGFYTNAAKAFAASLGGSPNAQLHRSNVIRAFFIANGRRLLTEQPAWMS
ncbi:hypothetical protein [Phytohabitans rumicis]|uniref:Uncharacterized protein n=1 Tax=Phytohabitans rumicis TaxID=1076125 RepID=A0A6V8LKH1_9ACTN|nr:hypothetical protein [Phytohabitans rumicis]GFJ95129.1 hypothetical protein Prum_087710 [Phytohabitans rumicis]